jgi:hypothetical protein
MKLFALLLPCLLTVSAHAATPRTRILGEIPFVAQGSFAEFNATMQKSRDEARSELLDQFGSLYIPSVMAGNDAQEAANAILNVIITLDQFHDAQVAKAQSGIPQALESQLLAQFDSLNRAQGLAPSERRAEIIRNGGWTAALANLRAGNPAGREQLAKDIFTNIDVVLYGSYTVSDAGVILTLTAEQLRSGEITSFEATGSMEQAIASLVQQLFSFAQENQRKAWANPQPQLEWLLPPPNLAEALPREAALFCEGQGARLPLARELILAAQGGNFRAGGVPALQDDDVVVVADLQRTTQRNYYFGTALTGDDPRGPVRNGAGLGTVHARFLCVKGSIGAAAQWEQDLYRAYRKSPAARPALEYLLTRLDAFGSVDRFSGLYASSAQAVQSLAKQGVVLSALLQQKLAALD